MLVKCKACSNKIERNEAYRVVVKDKNQYYCNVDEYVQQNIENECRFKSIDLIFEIIGETTNTNLFKELTEIAKFHTYEKMLLFLEANRSDLDKFMSKEFTSEYGKIRYFAAILKNQLGDFVVKKEEEREIVHADVIEEVKYQPTKKKSFTDFIDEY